MEAVFLASALLIGALLIGALLAVQASVNLQLTSAVGTPYGASTLQLVIAAGLLAVVTAAVGGLGALSRLPDAEPWMLLGGIASPLYITSAILLFPRLGALTSVGLFVTGQVLASLVIDLGGLLDVPRSPVRAGVLVGAAAVLVGITTVIRSQAAERPGSARAGRGGVWTFGARAGAGAGGVRYGWIGLGLLAGAVLPVQGAVNAALRTVLDQPLAVGTVSFVVATLTISIVLVVLRALDRTPAPRLAPLRAMPWWGWLGGAAAATYVTATFLLIPVIGAATTVALTVTGQQVASAVIDQYGLFHLPSRRLTVGRLGGLAALLAGSALVQFQ